MSTVRTGARRCWWTLLVTSLSISLLAPTAAVGQTPGEAQKLYDEGIALRSAGKHDQAADRFRRSLAVEHRPQTYLAYASELFELDKPEEAMAALDALYAEFGATMMPKTREKADKAMLVVAESLGLGRVAITIKEKGTLFVDGKEAGQLPLTTPLRLKEGSHSLKIVRDGTKPFERDIVVVKGELSTLEVPPLPVATVVELPGSDPKSVGSTPKPVQDPPTAPQVATPEVKPIPKPAIPPKPRTQIDIGGHVAFLAGLGKTDPQATTPPTTCGVYCMPSLGLLAGVDAGVSLRERLVISGSVEYLHATSTINVVWPRQNFAFANGVADADMDLEHVFTLDGGVAHVAIGTSAPIGKRVRIEGRVGAGVFIGQSKESVSGQIKPSVTAMQSAMTPTDVPEVTERSATIVLPVMRSRLGVSFRVGPVWLGIAAEGLISLTKGPAMCTPNLTANQTTVAAAGGTRIDETDCPDGTRSARPFERLFIVSPAVAVGTSF